MTEPTVRRSETFVLASLLVFATALRLPGCFGELWLDEVWTHYAAGRLESALGILTEFRHSNNHPLNTLVFYLLGDRDHAVLYRIHSLVAGVGSVALAFAAARPAGRAAGMLAALLCAASYPLVHYSSEARGYALVVCLGLATFVSLRRYAETRGGPRALGIWLLVALGFLSHLMYLHVFAAACVWLPVRLWRTGLRGARWVGAGLRALGPPLLFLAIFYATFVRPMRIGGGPGYSLPAVLSETLSLAFGGPTRGPGAVATALVAGLALAAAFGKLWRERRDEGLFFAVVAFLSPAVVLSASRPHVLFVRYFLLSTAFGYVALAPLLAAAWRRRGWQRAGVAALLGLFLAGNALHVADLVRYGHGDFRGAVRYMADHSRGPVVRVTSDHDFRGGLLLDYYRRFAPEKQFVYVPEARAPVPGLTWMLRHSLDERDDPPERVSDREGNSYELVRRFPCAGLSCLRWFLYARER